VTDGSYLASALVEVATSVWAPVPIERNLPNAGDVKSYDVDFDGDVDLVYTYPDAITTNVAWARNPAVGHGDGSPSGSQAVLDGANWQLRPVGQVDTQADVIALGDVDFDGFDDVVVRSRGGLVVQWFRHPGAADGEPVFPPPDVTPSRFNFPWQVYTLAEFAIGRPAGIAVGDLTGDGINEVAVAAGGVVVWFDSTVVPSVYDPWSANFVIDDTKANGTTDDPNDPDFVDNGTVINAVTIVDLDGDGFGDMLGTLDRRVESGLSDDTLLWFRNTLGDQGQAVE
jgi:hypothetical protein